MGELEFPIELSPDDWIRCRIVTDRGRVERFTVQYETIFDRTSYPVVRYDSHHHRAHIDFIDHRGRQYDKRWLDFFYPYNDGLSWAMSDIRQNWQTYKQRFLARMADER